jgi:formylglycine-generating enzyme required for sulfatase activity
MIALWACAERSPWTLVDVETHPPPDTGDGPAPHTGETALPRETGNLSPGCPGDMVPVPNEAEPAFCVDFAETTVTGLLGNADQGAAWPDGSTTATAAAVLGLVPSTGISWYQAWAICRNSGKHLCTVDEWRDACDGTIGEGGSTYPWGEEPDPAEVCAAPAADGTTAWTELQHAGGEAGCVSGAGVYDQVGNAWEWADPEQASSDGTPVTAKVGGAWYTGRDHVACGDEPETGHPPDFDGTIAVRCCRDWGG